MIIPIRQQSVLHINAGCVQPESEDVVITFYDV
jgi:hypothetical protein